MRLPPCWRWLLSVGRDTFILVKWNELDGFLLGFFHVFVTVITDTFDTYCQHAIISFLLSRSTTALSPNKGLSFNAFKSSPLKWFESLQAGHRPLIAHIIKFTRDPNMKHQEELSLAITKKISHYTFDLSKKLGQGSFSQVFQGVDERNNGAVAVKRVRTG